MCVCVVNFRFFFVFIMGENVASALNVGPSAGQGPEEATPEARRAAFVETIRALGVESADTAVVNVETSVAA